MKKNWKTFFPPFFFLIMSDIPAPRVKILSKNAKKAQRIFAKYTEYCPDYNRVFIRMKQDMMVIVSDAEVYRNPVSNHYIVLGTPNYQSLSQQQATNAAQKYSEQVTEEKDEKPEVEEENVENLDFTDAQEQDIETILAQCPDVSRADAIKALQQTNWELIEALLKVQE
eukprot:TRINITY_DN2527_c0_g1_i3.p1 TRINITY_DN2527_c0_g1~~TRINITY_DN2527_c0_g1_i3.p1  ORF type:complete len:169 (+),score=51.13 TRINITY_DN2527_c0_g1_i3:403-909(+)